MRRIELDKYTIDQAALVEQCAQLNGLQLSELTEKQQQLYEQFKKLPTDECRLLESLITSAPKDASYTVDDLRNVRRVLAALDRDGPVLLEEAEYLWLSRRIQLVEVTGYAPAILNLVDKIEAAQTVAPTA